MMKKSLGSIFKKILLGMHLWLPIAYTAIFWLIALISQKVATAGMYYFLGLSCSLLLSLILTYLTAHRSPQALPPARREDIPIVKEERRLNAPARTEKSRTDIDIAKIYDEQVKYMGSMTATPNSMAGDPASPENTAKGKTDDLMRNDAMQRYYGEATTPDWSAQKANDELYPNRGGGSRGEKNEHPTFTPYIQPVNAEDNRRDSLGGRYDKSPIDNLRPYQLPNKNIANTQTQSNFSFEKSGESGRRPFSSESTDSRRSYEGKSESVISGESTGIEKPRIYRTRKDPSMLVYEYKDRLERYRVNPDGTLTYVSTEEL